MEQVQERQLIALRIQKAMALIAQLRDSYRELESRFRMVETHNIELQELIDKVSADQQVVEQAIESAMEGLVGLETSLGDLDNFGTMNLTELEDAEAFTIGGEGEDLETFEENN